MTSDNFTLMYGQQEDALAGQKISAEEANKAVRETQEVDVEEEEDLSEEESSEEEDHHMGDIAEDKTNHPKRGSYSTALAIIEAAFKKMDEVDEDLWIGDSGASSHLIGLENGVFDKKMIKGSVNTAYGEKMKIKCEGKVNVNRFTKTGYESKGTLSVKVVEGLKIKLFSFTTALANGWMMNGYKQKNGEVVIMLTHDRYPAIIFDQMIKCGSRIVMGAKMKILNIPRNLFGSREEDVQEKLPSENRTCNKCLPSRYS